MNFIKNLFAFFLILLGIISCDFIIPNDENGNFDWTEGDYAYIDLENNSEWETGIIAQDGRYLLAKKDTTNNGYIGYINSQTFGSKGFALYFDENLELLSFVSNNGVCYINRTEDDKADILLVLNNENEIYENIAIPSTKIINTKAAPIVPIIVGIASGAATIKSLWDTIQATNKLSDGNWDGARLDYLKILAGSAIKNPFGGFALDGAFVLLDKAKEDLDKKGQTCFLGNCQVQISQTKIGIKKFRIDVTVTGYETLPIISKITGEKSIVFGGIAVAKTPYVTINSNDQIIQDWVINGNGTNSIEFELPEDRAYYAIPYLLPTRGGKYEFKSNVRHGNTIVLPFFNGVIDEFTQNSFNENDGKYQFKCSAHAICNTKEDQYWKLYYEDDNGWKEFYSAKTFDEPSISSSNTGEFEFDIELDSDLFEDGKKDIKLGLAIFNNSHQMISASDPQIFTLSTEIGRWVDLGLPSGILWAKYDLGSNSPDQQGDPYMWGYTESLIEDYAYYVYETVDLPQMPYNEEMGFYMTGFGRTVGTCLTPDNDISGTDYDAASVIWGDGARIPTRDECLELINNCSIREGKYKDTEGYYLKGMNNNEIFLSSFYWTSTMFVDIDPLYELKWDPENERYVIYNIDYLDYNCAYIFWPLKYESWPTIPVSESTSLKIEFWGRSDALPIRPVKRNNTI